MIVCLCMYIGSNNIKRKISHEFEKELGGTWQGLKGEDIGDIGGEEGK